MRANSVTFEMYLLVCPSTLLIWHVRGVKCLLKLPNREGIWVHELSSDQGKKGHWRKSIRMKLDCEENILRKTTGLHSWKNALSYLGSLTSVGKHLVTEASEAMAKLSLSWNEEGRIIFSRLWSSHQSKSNGSVTAFINDFKKHQAIISHLISQEQKEDQPVGNDKHGKHDNNLRRKVNKTLNSCSIFQKEIDYSLGVLILLRPAAKYT